MGCVVWLGCVCSMHALQRTLKLASAASMDAAQFCLPPATATPCHCAAQPTQEVSVCVPKGSRAQICASAQRRGTRGGP